MKTRCNVASNAGSSAPPISKSWRITLMLCASLFLALLVMGWGTPVHLIGLIAGAPQYEQKTPQWPPANQKSDWTKVAEGEYAIFEQGNKGAVGPFAQEVYNFRESWILWRAPKGEYHLEGVRNFESPEYEHRSDPFLAELSRDLTLTSVKEFAKLTWVRDSGPLSCEFLPEELHCSSGGSDPKRSIELRTKLKEPYGLLWPISPFSLASVIREVERDPNRPTVVDLVRIEQPSARNPVETTIMEGPLSYLGQEDIEAAGQMWHAYKFSLKVTFQPEYLIWTSPRGLLLALAIEHEHKNWPKEGLKLTHFQSWDPDWNEPK